MAIYKYCSLCTIYDGSVNGRSFQTDFRESACYGYSLSMFRPGINHAKYTIILITNESYVDRNRKNCCWMEKHQLENYLRRIASLKPFKYTVETCDFHGAPAFKIDLEISGTRKETTFVLQCIKRTYEWPLSFFLQQAYEMQKLPAFKFDSILNLYNVVFSTYWNYKNLDHSFSGNTAFEKYKTIRERLPKVKFASDLYPTYVASTHRARKIAEISYCGDVPNITSQWNEDFFRQILPTYIDNYYELKK